jgi:hypothetical protein
MENIDSMAQKVISATMQRFRFVHRLWNARYPVQQIVKQIAPIEHHVSARSGKSFKSKENGNRYRDVTRMSK